MKKPSIVFFRPVGGCLLHLLHYLPAEAGLIHTDPQVFLPGLDDLPNAEMYHIPPHEQYPLPNDLIIYLLGDGPGEARIHNTGRLVGWRVHFQRSNWDANSPCDITAVVTQFSASRGARLNLETYSLSHLYPERWQRLPLEPGLGEYSLVEMQRRQTGGDMAMVSYLVSFSYRNIGVRIEVAGGENQVAVEDAIQLGQVVEARLRAAALSPGPVPTPTFGF